MKKNAKIYLFLYSRFAGLTGETLPTDDFLDSKAINVVMRVLRCLLHGGETAGQ